MLGAVGSANQVDSVWLSSDLRSPTAWVTWARCARRSWCPAITKPTSPTPTTRTHRPRRDKSSGSDDTIEPADAKRATRIRSHSESHIVELDDGSRWQIFPGDLDLTLGWKPETELSIVPTDDEISSHALIGDGGIPAGESWSIREVKSILKDGWPRPPRIGSGSHSCRPLKVAS